MSVQQHAGTGGSSLKPGSSNGDAVVTAPQPTGPRIMYKVTTEMVSSYASETLLHRTQDPATVDLISSELAGPDRGRHAPAWDVDHRSVLTVDSDGSLTWWVDASLRLYGFRRFLRVASRYGLVADRAGHPDRRSLTRAARSAAYTAASDRMVDTRMRDEILRRLGATLGTSLESAVATADTVGTDPHQGAYVRAPRMGNPWPIPLSVPATMLPSTRNHHLYLDVELPWEQYRDLIRAAGRARILERGYVRMSLARKATHLRPPWTSKSDA